jgi:hypothetical protein
LSLIPYRPFFSVKIKPVFPLGVSPRSNFAANKIRQNDVPRIRRNQRAFALTESFTGLIPAI